MHGQVVFFFLLSFILHHTCALAGTSPMHLGFFFLFSFQSVSPLLRTWCTSFSSFLDFALASYARTHASIYNLGTYY
jgi:hypothetical protein